MPQKKSHRTTLLIAIGIIALLAAGGIFAWQNPFWGKRLPQPPESQPGALTDPTLATTSQPTAPTSLPSAAAQPEEDPQEEASPSAKPLCNGPAAMDILALVIDKQAQADSIRLIHLDFITPAVSVVAIPRDFYVPIVDMADHGITRGRINATYGYGEYYLGQGEGVFSLADNLYHNFGVSFDEYVVLKLSSVAELIDNIDGIEIHLEQPVADDHRYFAKGDHQLDGESAVDFMSIRYYDDDFHRIDRQTMVLQALLQKARGDLNLIQQTKLALSALGDDSVQTSLPVKALPPLICLGRTLDQSDVDFVQIPPDLYHPWTTPSGGAVQIPQVGVAAFLQDFQEHGLAD